MYLVHKQDIYEELSKIKIHPKEGEVHVYYDKIIPNLLENLEGEELSSAYPMRAIIIYNNPVQKEWQGQ